MRPHRIIAAGFLILIVLGCDPAGLFRGDPLSWLHGTWRQVPPFDISQLTEDFTPPLVTFRDDNTYVVSDGKTGTYSIWGGSPSNIEFDGIRSVGYSGLWESGGVRDDVTITNSDTTLDLDIRGSNEGIGPPSGRYVKVHLGKPVVSSAIGVLGSKDHSYKIVDTGMP